MKQFKILIIDDESANIEAISEGLKEENYKLLIPVDGESGYKIAINTLPDLIITEWNMPGISENYLATTLRQHLRNYIVSARKLQ